jgi:hypothetical protein
MEELEEMEPGFAIRFDEEWERIGAIACTRTA